MQKITYRTRRSDTTTSSPRTASKSKSRSSFKNQSSESRSPRSNFSARPPRRDGDSRPVRSSEGGFRGKPKARFERSETRSERPPRRDNDSRPTRFADRSSGDSRPARFAEHRSGDFRPTRFAEKRFGDDRRSSGGDRRKGSDRRTSEGGFRGKPKARFERSETRSERPPRRDNDSRPTRFADRSSGDSRPARFAEHRSGDFRPTRFAEKRFGDDRRSSGGDRRKGSDRRTSEGGFRGKPKARFERSETRSERPPRRDNDSRPTRFADRSSGDSRPARFAEHRSGDFRPTRFAEKRFGDDRRSSGGDRRKGSDRRTSEGGFRDKPKPRSERSARPARRGVEQRPSRSGHGSSRDKPSDESHSIRFIKSDLANSNLIKTRSAPSTEKLQKVIARAGLGARREIEEWIKEGRVSVNGQVAQLGDRVSNAVLIRVDGHPISQIHQTLSRRRVLIYNKPESEICTQSDPEGRPTVFEQLPVLRGGRWVMIGRLDINSSGLLLFTNDGDWAHQMMHPSSEVEREYAVRVFGEVQPEMLTHMLEGVEIDGYLMKFESIQEAGGEGINRWYHVILKEGRNREVRNLWESQGLQVSRLTRIRYGNIVLPRALHIGQWKELTKEEVDELTEISTQSE